MSDPTGLPSHLVAAIDQQHACANASLTDLLRRLRDQGLAEADPAYRIHVIGLGLYGSRQCDAVELAAAAISRLLELNQKGPKASD